MTKGERKVQNDDDSNGDDNASDDENGIVMKNLNHLLMMILSNC